MNVTEAGERVWRPRFVSHTEIKKNMRADEEEDRKGSEGQKGKDRNDEGEELQVPTGGSGVCPV